MSKILKLTIFIYLIITSFTVAISKQNFFEEALKMYQEEKYDDARFLFERNIVYNPKDAISYLYLAKERLKVLETCNCEEYDELKEIIEGKKQSKY